jgi:twinkle protein
VALSEAAIAWAKSRGISRRTLEAFGAASAMRGWGERGRVETLALPYRRGGKCVNAKYRPISFKDFRMEEGGELRFFNIDDVLAGSKKIAYIFEGEMDALAAFEAGLPKDCILSVPNGAPQQSTEDPLSSDRYKFAIEGLKDGLSAVERFVIATDADGPGRILRQDLVNIIGPARCWFLDWRGVKDANEALLRWTPGELLDFLEGEPQEWPISGLYRLSQIPEPAPIDVWWPGFPEWEKKLGFAPGMLSVFTGHPGHGKTLLAMQLWFNVCRDYGVKAAFASFETAAKPHQRKNIRQFMFGRPQEELTEEQIAKADRWNEEHFLWINHPDRRPDFRWFMDLAEVAVIRHGVRILQIDPWNKLEADRPGDIRETDWIRDRLNELLSFAKDFQVHVQVLCHPAKGQGERSRSRRPELEDIAGSKHWDNIVDQGLAVFRPKVFEDGQRKTEATLYHLKSRFEEIGYDCKLELEYDLATRRYRSTDYKQGWEA